MTNKNYPYLFRSRETYATRLKDLVLAGALTHAQVTYARRDENFSCPFSTNEGKAQRLEYIAQHFNNKPEISDNNFHTIKIIIDDIRQEQMKKAEIKKLVGEYLTSLGISPGGNTGLEKRVDEAVEKLNKFVSDFEQPTISEDAVRAVVVSVLDGRTEGNPKFEKETTDALAALSKSVKALKSPTMTPDQIRAEVDKYLAEQAKTAPATPAAAINADEVKQIVEALLAPNNAELAKTIAGFTKNVSGITDLLGKHSKSIEDLMNGVPELSPRIVRVIEYGLNEHYRKINGIEGRISDIYGQNKQRDKSIADLYNKALATETELAGIRSEVDTVKTDVANIQRDMLVQQNSQKKNKLLTWLAIGLVAVIGTTALALGITALCKTNKHIGDDERHGPRQETLESLEALSFNQANNALTATIPASTRTGAELALSFYDADNKSIPVNNNNRFFPVAEGQTSMEIDTLAIFPELSVYVGEPIKASAQLVVRSITGDTISQSSARSANMTLQAPAPDITSVQLANITNLQITDLGLVSWDIPNGVHNRQAEVQLTINDQNIVLPADTRSYQIGIEPSTTYEVSAVLLGKIGDIENGKQTNTITSLTPATGSLVTSSEITTIPGKTVSAHQIQELRAMLRTRPNAGQVQTLNLTDSTFHIQDDHKEDANINKQHTKLTFGMYVASGDEMQLLTMAVNDTNENIRDNFSVPYNTWKQTGDQESFDIFVASLITALDRLDAYILEVGPVEDVPPLPQQTVVPVVQQIAGMSFVLPNFSQLEEELEGMKAQTAGMKKQTKLAASTTEII
ncbi:MAG: hypothetical protein FWD89_03750 [Firmicutes bacterium]|nr:hypothetical protein [Bacillota bacterium]